MAGSPRKKYCRRQIMATKIQPQLVYQRPESLTETVTHYCPGCTHGIAHRLWQKLSMKWGSARKLSAWPPWVVRYLLQLFLITDFVEAAHGRAPAMATGIKRVLPETLFTPTRGTATWPQSAWPRSCTPPPAARISP